MKSEDVGRICTIAGAERDRSAECHKLKKAPHPVSCLSARLLEERGERCVQREVDRERNQGEKATQISGKQERTTSRDRRLKVAKFLNRFPVVLCA